MPTSTPLATGSAGSVVVAQLEPARVACRSVETCAPALVVEIGDRRRAELAREPMRGAPQLGLLGGVAGVHVAQVERIDTAAVPGAP